MKEINTFDNNNRRGILNKIVRAQGFSIFCALIVIMVALQCINSGFMSTENMLTLLKTLSFYGIVAVGMTLLIIGGDIDISVGSTAGFGAIFSTWMMVKWNCFGMLGTSMEWLGVALCLLVTIIVSSVVGLINGAMIIKLKLPAFVATVATMYGVRGVVLIITNGTPVYPLPDTFNTFGAAGIPVGGGRVISVFFIILIVLIVGLELILRKTTFGRNIYATGSNIHAAQLAGIKTNRVRFYNFLILASLAGFAGSLNAAYIGQGYTLIGQGWEMQVIATVAIGGIKLSGGSGTMIGTLLGLFIMNTLNNAVVLIGINTFLQDVIIGAIMILIVAFDQFRSRRKVHA